MNRSLLSIALVMIMVPLSGCIGSWDFVPGEDYKPTGKTVHLRMWVADMVEVEPFEGFSANLWAFCAEPADPNDEYSRNAIEYREPSGRVGQLNPEGVFIYDDEQTQKCSVPGPQLRVQQGDKVIVDFVNDHFHPHTIHWHGQFVPWNSDGVPGSTQDSVQPGESFRYEFEAKRAGTLWYHCHVDTQFHVMQGLYGVIIVEPQNQKYEPEVDRDYTLVFSNLIRELVEPDPDQVDPHAKHRHGQVCGLSGVPGCQNPAITQDADVFLINGVSAPNTFKRNDTLVMINPGETIRLRFLNAGPFTTETIHLHGHDMLVTHIDGNPLNPEARYWVDTILIGPGQRYDVIVTGEEGREGIWVMHTHITSRVTNSHQYPGGMLTKLIYEDWLAEQGGDISPYDGVEVPGGIPYIPPYTIPPDVTFNDEVQTDGSATTPIEFASHGTYVEMPCAVREYYVEGQVQVQGGGNPNTGTTSLTATLTDWVGTEVASVPVANDGTFTFDIFDEYVVEGEPYEVRDMPMNTSGNLTISVTGTAAQDLEIGFMGTLDYYETKEQMQYYSTNRASRDTCEEVFVPGAVVYPPQNTPPEPNRVSS